MVYGVIGLSLGLYVWRANKRAQLKKPGEEQEIPEDHPGQRLASGQIR